MNTDLSNIELLNPFFMLNQTILLLSMKQGTQSLLPDIVINSCTKELRQSSLLLKL